MESAIEVAFAGHVACAAPDEFTSLLDRAGIRGDA